MKKSISILFLVTILLQSCVVYQKTPVSINEAYKRGSRVKIISKLGESYIFNGIYIKDSIYYGVEGDNLVRLDTAQISGIYLQDNKKSKNQTKVVSGGVPIVLVVVLTALAAVAAVVVTVWLISLIQ